MSDFYTIRSGDTLSNVAVTYYGDASFAQKLGEFNSLLDINKIKIGMEIEIPAISDLVKPQPVTNAPIYKQSLIQPNGYKTILNVFGNIEAFIKNGVFDETRWKATYIKAFTLPFALPFGTTKVTRMQCHVLMEPIFSKVFLDIEASGLVDSIKSYGGCYNYRRKRKSNGFSTHSWGIAVDLNAETNAMGTKGDISPKLVQIFQDNGFKWGGDWTGKGCDPMHFQYCTGY